MDKIIDRIRNLIALANGGATPEEAANALALAQRLMAKHRIEASQVEAASPAREVAGAETICDAGADVVLRWVWLLFISLCEINSVRAFIKHGSAEVKGRTVRRMMLCGIGRLSDRQAVGYMHLYLVRVLREMSNVAAKAAGVGNSPKWRNEFLNAAAETVSWRLRQQASKANAAAREEAVAGGSDMVRVDQDAADLKAETDALATRMGLRVGKASWTQARSGSSAVYAGRRAGAEVNLSAGKGLGA